MNGEFKLVIGRAVREIAQYYSSEESFAIKKGKHLPNRGAIIGVIKDLRRVMFPGYFGSENITDTAPEYFIGNTLTEVYVTLKKQIETALIYQNTDQISEEEISERAMEICKKFFGRLAEIQQMLLKDVQAGFDGDPAAKSKEEIIFSYPGLFAIFVYRIAHELYLMDVPFIPRIMTEYAHSRTGIDINSGATIGEYFFIDHGTGVVIGETTCIGNHVKLYQGVTLGALSTRSGQQLAGVKRHPTIQDNVTIYSGSTILGGETVIGEECVIAGGAFITSSVPPRTKVTVKKPELNFKGPSQEDVWE
ncbi:serine O-acetyltransferase [Frisingicoccus sp.]|uniref:serine O-acetyltransferase n=2 Tax=Frisingicoccus sp. TaxID=1918627 RepID=UPI0025B7E1DB|nr:serine acetyltransferase [Frisingicoccus sp.]MDD6232657.1 serine acetyltransferase [Frisingicoccus sp.]MDY4834130.1 serine acetyltransferase [Frisingicoccus sp.]MDY4923498.1 serine acetyltransferase [Frisingicoccus sp.]MDY5955778.1 serine acetyltransferase [Frisingicoccus sp.]